MTKKGDKKNVDTVTVHATRLASRKINRLAEILLERHGAKMEKLGYKRANAAIAIDYLIFTAHSHDMPLLDGEDRKDNLYRQIINVKED